MATSQVGKAVQNLRRAFLVRDGAGLSDAQLLECYVARQDEAAFEALVRRHGPMVMGVCRRVAFNGHDAEDAFQATFLVLVRKAGSIKLRGLLANWLYGVAYNTALKARAAAAKRRLKERQVITMPAPEVVQKDLWDDLHLVLDQELSRLPDKYRVPIVLCDLEGKTRKEVARQLGCPEGSISSRLARARVMLARRLARHGVTVPGGVLAVLLTEKASSAGIPTALVVSTVKAARFVAAGQAAATGLISPQVAALVKGVMQSMLLTKLKIVVAALVVVTLVMIGAGGLPRQSEAQAVAAVKPALPVGSKANAGKNSLLVKGAQILEINAKEGAISVALRKKTTATERVLGELKSAEAAIRVAEKQQRLAVALAEDALAERAKPGADEKKIKANQFKALYEKALAERKLVEATSRAKMLATRLEGLPVAKDAKITIGKKKAALSDLKAKMRVSLQMSADDDGIIITGIFAE